MKRLLALSTFLLAAGVIFLTPAIARAQSNTSTLTVTANVVASCEVVAAPLAFGAYHGQAIDTDTTIDVTCNSVTSHWIGLDRGTYGDREMEDPVSGDLLGYELFRDLARTVVWDEDPAQGASYTINAATSTSTVYGTLLANQIRSIGNYQDDVLVTVNF
jgi:spore coat protein U-like protein